MLDEGFSLRLSIVRALALDSARRTGEALAAVREALVMAEPGGVIRSFTDEGSQMAKLLEAMAAEIPPCPTTRHASSRPAARAPPRRPLSS
jgi:hypothetical protein